MLKYIKLDFKPLLTFERDPVKRDGRAGLK